MSTELDANTDNTIDDNYLAGGTPSNGMQIVFDTSASPNKQWKLPYVYQATAPADTSVVWYQDVT